MHHHFLIFPVLLVMGTPVAGRVEASDVDDFVFFHEEVMGTALELRVRARDRDAARWAEAQVLGEIDRLSAILSGYDSGSEFRRWRENPSEPVEISAELFEVLKAADDWRAATGGAFDPRVAALSRLWDATPRLINSRPRTLWQRPWQGRRRMPGDSTPQPAPPKRSGTARSAWMESPRGSSLNVPAIRRSTPARGVFGLLLNVGGDLRASGEGFGTVGLAPPKGDTEASEPFAFLEIRDRSVATSGAAHRGWEIEGRWHSHIIDPRTAARRGMLRPRRLSLPEELTPTRSRPLSTCCRLPRESG